ncbi:MAG: TraR/DksA C4-type zinc finger protein, partial [Syntrophobacter sp.]
MSKDEIIFLRNMLLDRRSSILERVRKLAAAWHELEERAIELEEEAQKASIAKPYDQLNGTGKLEIEQIDLALSKMNLGEYGICESCGDDISPKRLEVLPWARLCVDCARDFEKQKKTLPSMTTPEIIGVTRIPEEYQGLNNDQIVLAIYERLHSDDRIEAEELKVSFRKGILYLEGTVPGELDHETIIQTITDVMGFTTVADQIEINELNLDASESEDGLAGRAGIEDGLFYDNDDMHQDMY